jgi:hypothetical protein
MAIGGSFPYSFSQRAGDAFRPPTAVATFGIGALCVACFKRLVSFNINGLDVRVASSNCEQMLSINPCLCTVASVLGNLLLREPREWDASCTVVRCSQRPELQEASSSRRIQSVKQSFVPSWEGMQFRASRGLCGHKKRGDWNRLAPMTLPSLLAIFQKRWMKTVRIVSSLPAY